MQGSHSTMQPSFEQALHGGSMRLTILAVAEPALVPAA